MSRALVLGGGGVTGIAWELGAALGLRDAGLDLLSADVTIGTSAGAAVAAELHSGVDLEELYAVQLRPEHHEIPAELDLRLLAEIFGDLAGGLRGGPPFGPKVLAKVGAKALAAPTVSEAERRRVIEHRLPNHDWPEAAVRVTAVDARSGAFVVFDETAGASLVDAVAASCAVPGIWPPVSIGDRRFMDGGVRSPTNADLAHGHDEVLVLAPLSGPSEGAVRAELAALEADGARVALLSPDTEAQVAMGPNALDPAARRPSAEAGRRQGATSAAAIARALAPA